MYSLGPDDDDLSVPVVGVALKESEVDVVVEGGNGCDDVTVVMTIIHNHTGTCIYTCMG